MTVAILLFVWCPLIILAFNYWDYRVTKDGGKPNYIIYRLARGMAAILHGTVCLMVLEDRHVNYGMLSGWQLLMLWAPYIGFEICSFWIVYEIVRNIWTQKPLLYYDDSELDSGWVDAFFAKVGHTFHAFCKLLSLIITVLCIIAIWTRY